MTTPMPDLSDLIERVEAATGPDRSARAEVRNPVLALPAMHRLAELSDAESGAVIAVMLDLKADAAERAQECWRRHKGPMAAYWKAVSVYAGHTAKALRRLSALRARAGEG